MSGYANSNRLCGTDHPLGAKQSTLLGNNVNLRMVGAKVFGALPPFGSGVVLGGPFVHCLFWSFSVEERGRRALSGIPG